MEKVTLPNRIDFDALRQMKDDQIALVSPESLLLLQEDLAERKESLSVDAKLLQTVTERRFRNLATFAYKAAGTDTGTVDLLDKDGFVVKCARAKNVTWDQAQLKDLFEKIKLAGDDPAVYIVCETSTVYKVNEIAFKNWPPAIQKAFAPARTVTPGSSTYQIKRKKD
jgi:hypothetical protein